MFRLDTRSLVCYGLGMDVNDNGDDLAPNEFQVLNSDDTTPSLDEWAAVDDLESAGAFDMWNDRKDGVL